MLSVELADELARLGFKELDRGLMMGPDRRITRNAAQACRMVAAGSSSVGGIRYESRLSDEWECWAVWQPFALDEGAQRVQPVDPGDPALRAAAGKLRMSIARPPAAGSA